MSDSERGDMMNKERRTFSRRARARRHEGRTAGGWADRGQGRGRDGGRPAGEPHVPSARRLAAKPVKLIVPYPPGGPTDIVARVVGQQLGERLKQPFVVENRAGAGGNIGAEVVAKAPADGYTLLIGTTAHAINRSLFPT